MNPILQTTISLLAATTIPTQLYLNHLASQQNKGITIQQTPLNQILFPDLKSPEPDQFYKRKFKKR